MPICASFPLQMIFPIQLSRSLALAILVLQTADQAAPNIIMVISDDQGWGDVGLNGHPDPKPPHLDAMAANG